jgi:thiamine-phosphate pyrophosphorylase
MRGLYAIVDVSMLTARQIDVVTFARAVLEARPCALQVRAKHLPTREFLALLRSVAPLCRAQSVPLVANDRVDLAILTGCEYVHLGQGDLPIEQARRIGPTLRVGLSTHTLEQLDRALAERPAYVAYGPVFPTGSKVQPDPCVGIQGLRAAWARASAARIPLVAIGGITLERAREVAPFASAAAVIAALVPPAQAAVVGDAAEPAADVLAQVASRARQLQAALGSTGAIEART